MNRSLARTATDKNPVPEVDFSLHIMEDGSQVSTLERVVKGNAMIVPVALASRSSDN